MLEQGNFYGKGSTGVCLAVLFGLYTVHQKYFVDVLLLVNKLKQK